MLNNIKTLGILLAILSLSSCDLFFYNYAITDEGGSRPISPRYKLAKPVPYQLKDTDPIDTDALYISYSKLEYGGESQDLYIGIRFFANGRFFYHSSRYKDSLSVKLFNRIGAAYLTGYYRMDSHNELQAESFGLLKHYDSTKAFKYTYERGYFKGDTLVLFSGLGNDKPFPKLNYREGLDKPTNAHLYVLNKVKGLSGKADW